MVKGTLLFILGCCCQYLSAQLTVSKLFSDHMVLQRGIGIPIWGQASVKASITVDLGTSHVTVTADSSGKWIARLPQHDAGGPYSLTITEVKHPGSRIEFSDVLVGDVWLASGQSNMELQVQQAKDATVEITNANYPTIRFFNVPHAKSLKPVDNISGGSWAVCDSNSVKQTSAVAYFFARKLSTDLNVPVGILQTTWGGTPVEAWTSREMLLSSPITRQKVFNNDSLNVNHFVKDSLDLIKFWDIVYHPKNKADAHIPQVNYDDSKWPEVTLPSVIRDWGTGFYEGIVWMRKLITLPDNFTGKELTINLGHPEMNYSLYVNGEMICKTMWNANPSHQYTIPSRLIKRRIISITVRLAALWGGGGFNLPATDMYVTDGTSRISIEGRWKYRKDLEPAIPKIYNYQYYPSYLFNAMVNPLIPYGIRGFIWYQGEANDSAAFHYRTLFPMLITDWRIRWQQGYLPFLYIQLPNYRKSSAEPSESQWAELREAQSMTLMQPNTGMVCTIDIGEENSIHPLNKQDVGTRLALQALSKTYGKKIISSGPVFESFQREGKGLRIHFLNDGSSLAIRNKLTLKGFAVSGADKKFYWATSKIEGNDVVIYSDNVETPVAIRYDWGDNPDGNLINAEGFPAVPFRTE